MSDDTRFFSFLKERIGLDVTSVGELIIERALRQRFAACGGIDSDAYWLLLQGSGSEQQALIEAVIVPETWFFRYAESFVALGKLAFERLHALNGVRPLRILSVPCSTGEEPYSIAMALFDAGFTAQQFKINAIDISPLSIQRAKRGVYGKNSFRGERIDFRERYFTPISEGYQIDQRVRDQVDFQPGNILDPMLPAKRLDYDFVFCRNLLIYFDQATQRHVFEALKRLTHIDGVLFIGPAEGSLLSRMGMRSTGIPQSFAFRHAGADAEIAKPTLPSVLSPIARTSPRKVVDLPLPTPAASSRPFGVSATAFAGRGMRPAAVPASAGGDDVATLLATIASLANQGKSAEARAACERYLQRHEPVAQVFYWLGLLSEVAGSTGEAQSFYRKALYLQPQHPEALAQLAALLAAQGDVVGARRLQDRAARNNNKEGSRR
jgi:chemotaxis protein methyltransferase WspC